MKKIIIVLTALFMCVSVNAQETVQKTRAERKAERKELKEKREKESSKATEEAIASGNFVLKARELRDKYGRLVFVDPSLNFVAKRGNDAYVQFGVETGMGYNGIGGVTFKGKVSDYKIIRDKKHNGYSISFTTTGTYGTISVNIQSNVTGERADARVLTTWGDQLSFSGEIEQVLTSETNAAVTPK
jgi:hypothetical protein